MQAYSQSQTLMQIQFESTPPKKTHPIENLTPVSSFQTPEKVNVQSFQTPPKSKANLDVPADISSPKRKQNPQSKNLHRSSKKSFSPSSSKKITPFQISRLEQDYIYLHGLGSGNFSSVSLYSSRLTQQLFAIKTAKANTMSVNQVQALSSLRIFAEKCNNVVKYFHSWIEDDMLYLVMEYCDDSLKNAYDKTRMQGRQFSQSEIKEILKQVLRGLQCLHSHEMVHLDIKPDNLLYKQKILKISDLGLCRGNRMQRKYDLDEGDARYLAPEILNYNQTMDLTKADIYSLGITIYEALSLEILQNNGPKWREYRSHGLNLKGRMDLQEYSQALLDIIERMTHPSWQFRPSAKDLLKEDYFKESISRGRHQLLTRNPRSARKKEPSL